MDLDVPGFKPPRYERRHPPGAVGALTLPAVLSPASSPRKIATARSDRSDSTQFLPLVSGRDRASSPRNSPGGNRGRAGAGAGAGYTGEEALGLGLGETAGGGGLALEPTLSFSLPSHLLGLSSRAAAAAAKGRSTIEQIQRGSGCIYSKSRSSHLLLTASVVAKNRDRDRDRERGRERGRPFKEEYMDDNYRPDEDALDLVLWR